jgi:DNA polymerase-3 subunit gamma/tau
VLGTASGQAVQDLVAAIAEDAGAQGIDLINAVVDGGTDPRQFARQVVDYVRGLLLIRLGNPALVDAYAGPETRKVMQQQAGRFDPAALLRILRAFTAAGEQRGGWISQLPIELAFVECLRAVPAVDPPPPAPSPAPAPARSALKEPAPAARPADPSHPAATPAAIPLGTVSAQWDQVVTACKKYHPNLPALLEHCRPVEIQGDTIVLGFKNDVLLSKASDGDRRVGIEKALKEVLGVALNVRCVVSDAEVSLPPDLDSNGVVAEALKLGGKLRKQKH